jgi:hypothetical protein
MVLTGAREGQGRPGLGWGGSKRRNVGYRTCILTMLGMRLVDDRSGSIRGARSILVHVPQGVPQYVLWYSVQQKKWAGRANGPSRTHELPTPLFFLTRLDVLSLLCVS